MNSKSWLLSNKLDRVPKYRNKFQLRTLQILEVPNLSEGNGHEFSMLYYRDADNSRRTNPITRLCSLNTHLNSWPKSKLYNYRLYIILGSSYHYDGIHSLGRRWDHALNSDEQTHYIIDHNFSTNLVQNINNGMFLVSVVVLIPVTNLSSFFLFPWQFSIF